ncbi:MAG: hypothetical protein L6R42_005230 [Xanthoria sp. 1 TBL-2021]|nr:MAG: hypothetical protein L6R42_005230 [Xanthoria sp. 1 TBL-2021]
MAVPNAHREEQYVPPPLPPPRHIEELAAGSDPGWRWGNSSNHGGFGGGKFASSISSSSSLRGSWDSRMEDEGFPDRPDPSKHNPSITSTNLPPALDRKYDFSRHIDEGYHSLSGSSLSSNRLRGERHLEQRNVDSASQAYDNKLLSKIGKPKTPPHVSRTSSVDAASPSSSLSFYQSGRHPHQLKSLSISEGSTGSYPNSPFKREPLSSRSAESPRSRAISPSLLSSAASAKSFMDWRSPTWEGGTPTSAGSDPPSLVPQSRFGSFSSQYQQQQRHQSRRRSVFSSYDESAAGSLGSEGASRGSKRGSQDQRTALQESDSTSDFPYMDETGAMQQLHLEDRASLSLDPALQQYSPSPVITSDPRLGMKRRASSPPPDSSHDDKAPLHSAGSNSDLYQRHTQAAHSTNRASPVNRFTAQQGSASSASSTGLRNGSYASPGGLSVGSSLTSLSPNHERLSPTSEYPNPQPHPERDSPYITSHPSPHSSLSHSHPAPTSENQSAAAARNMSTDTPTPRKQNNPPNIQAPHICHCCLKKPKKFETLEELRAHESEKQYACNFCHNRFKNKNEAERHQNSLHVRRHSWSCATLAGQYERVFHPSTLLPSQHPNQAPPPPDAVAATEICGYCGQEFPNEPPDWADRVAHLTNTHKFGECNQSKKFFRADHFRQHLKHSHAGTSGKWTNMLEAECMKEEPVPEMMPQPAQLQPSMQQPMPKSLPQQMQPPMHPMQDMQPGPSMQQGLGGAPVANMGAMPGAVLGRPTAMTGPSGLSSETIDEMKEEM